MNALQDILDRPKRDSYKTAKPGKRQRTALDDVFDQGQNALYDSGAPGNRGRSMLDKPSTSVRSKTARANRTLGRTSSGRNFSDSYGIVQNPSRGIRGTQPGGMVDAGGALPPPPKSDKPIARARSPVVGSGIRSDLLDAANERKSFGDSVGAGKTLTSAPSKNILQKSVSDNASSMRQRYSGHDPEKFAAAVERRKKEKALARQRQFARAQMRSGEMFNADGTADLAGSMAAQAFGAAQRGRGDTGGKGSATFAELAAGLARGRRESNITEEDNRAQNEISRILAGEEVAQGEFGRSDRALDHQMGLLEMQSRPAVMQARADQQRADYETDHEQQMALLMGQNMPDYMQAQTASDLAEFQMGDEYHQRQMELQGLDSTPAMDELLGRYRQFSDETSDDPERMTDLILSLGEAASAMPADERSQVLPTAGATIEDVLRARGQVENWDPNWFMDLTEQQERIKKRRLDSIEALLESAGYSDPVQEQRQRAAASRNRDPMQDLRRMTLSY